MSDRLKELSEAGVSIWLDDLSRDRLESGDLADLIKNSSVVGVTTNPTIFAKALSDGEAYDAQVAMAAEGHVEVTESLVDDTITELTTTDVRNACDMFTEVFGATGGVDGRVSIEVSPDLAEDTGGTLHMAKTLWAAVDRPNVYIKIPAVGKSIPAITAALAEGINVNVTLIFGLDRYREVMEAYLAGLEQAKANGHDLSRIHSVASFFVSRVDTEVDKRLAELDEDVTGVKGRAGIANARLAFEMFEQFFTGQRWEALAAEGARLQRPLWASTGVKNEDYRDVMYVEDLTVEGTVNTMPEKTMDAFADHGEVSGDQVRPNYKDAHRVMDRMKELGVSYDDVISTLEREGVEKFVTSGNELRDTVRDQLQRAIGQKGSGIEAPDPNSEEGGEG